MIGFKILNYRTIEHLIRGTESTLYMALGRPVIDCGLRGSMLAVFTSQFLSRRMTYVDHWSPIDVGGVENGHSKLDREWASLLKLSPTSLAHLLTRARQDRELHETIVSHRPLPHVGGVMPSHILSHVSDAAAKHEWIYEVKLTQSPRCLPDEIERFVVPNTAAQSVRKWLGASRSDLIVPYNPAFGHRALR